MKPKAKWTIGVLPLLVTAPGSLAAALINLPTENHGLLTHDLPGFFQYVKRDFEGVISLAWEGGQYGFVRNPHRIGDQVVYTRFHEGIDIQPLHRSATGEPVDAIHAIAGGTVVYVNPLPNASNYGRYIVIEHVWDNCSYYSLYAHLSATAVLIGQRVDQGTEIATMGHTGEGIDRERAHLHLELNLMLNGHFNEWHTRYFPADANRHGLYNGINLAGIDIQAFYLALQLEPALNVATFVLRSAPWYKIIFPRGPLLDLPSRYPWLVLDPAPGPSWEISFDRTGLPVGIRSESRVVNEPTLSWVHPSDVPQAMMTKNMVQNRGSELGLTPNGKRLADLVGPAHE